MSTISSRSRFCGAAIGPGLQQARQREKGLQTEYYLHFGTEYTDGGSDAESPGLLRLLREGIMAVREEQDAYARAKEAGASLQNVNWEKYREQAERMEKTLRSLLERAMGKE